MKRDLPPEARAALLAQGFSQGDCTIMCDLIFQACSKAEEAAREIAVLHPNPRLHVTIVTSALETARSIAVQAASTMGVIQHFEGGRG